MECNSDKTTVSGWLVNHKVYGTRKMSVTLHNESWKEVTIELDKKDSYKDGSNNEYFRLIVNAVIPFEGDGEETEKSFDSEPIHVRMDMYNKIKDLTFK